MSNQSQAITEKQRDLLKELRQLGREIGLSDENIRKIRKEILSLTIQNSDALKREADQLYGIQELEEEITAQKQRQTDLSKLLETRAKNARKINEDIEGINERITKLADTIFSNTSDTYDEQKKLLKAKKAELLEARQSGDLSLRAYKNLLGQLDAQEKQLDIVQKIQEKYKDEFEQLSALGGLLSSKFGAVGKAIETGMNKGMSAFTKELAVSRDTTKAMQAGMKAFGGEITASIAKAMSVVGIITILYDILKSVTDEANQLSTETGLTFGQARKLADESKIVAANMGLQLATAKDIVDVQKETMAAFGTSAMLSNEQAANVAEMGKAFGYGAQQAAKVNNAFMSMGATSNEAASAQQSLAAEALKAGVNVGAVTKDIAENSKNVAQYFGGNVTALKNAAIEAAKMGMSIATMAKISDKLLDIQSSVAAQFEFQALSGRQLDLDMARQLALQGDIAGASKEVLNAVGSTAEFNKMSVLEKKKLAEATGMEVDELQKSLVVQEKLGDLTADQKAAMSGLNLSAAELNNLSAEQLQQKLADQQALNQSNKQLDDFMNTMKTALVPLAEALGFVFATLAPALKLVAAPIVFIRDVLSSITALFTGGYEALSGWGKALAIIGTVLTVAFLPTIVSAAFGLLSSAIGAIFTGFSMIPFGLGVPLAIAAVGGLISMFMGPIGKAQSTGDLAMGANNGPIVTNPREGTIFQGTKNDEVAMGPGVIGAAQGGGSATVVQQSGGTDPALINGLMTKLDELIQAAKTPPPIQIGSQTIKEISNQQASSNSFRQNYNGV